MTPAAASAAASARAAETRLRRRAVLAVALVAHAAAFLVLAPVFQGSRFAAVDLPKPWRVVGWSGTYSSHWDFRPTQPPTLRKSEAPGFKVLRSDSYFVAGEWISWNDAVRKHADWRLLSISLALPPIVFALWRRFRLPLGRAAGLALTAGCVAGLVLIAQTSSGRALVYWPIATALYGCAFLVAPPPRPRERQETDVEVRRLLRKHRADVTGPASGGSTPT